MGIKKSVILLVLLLLIPIIYAISYTSVSFNVNKIQVDSNYNSTHDIDIADIDGDGLKDIISDSYTNNSVVWYRQTSSNNWIQYVIDNDLRNAHDVKVGDIDGDNRTDIIAIGLSNSSTNYSQPNGTLRWYKNPTDPTIVNDWNITTIELSGDKASDGIMGARGLGLEDIDNDGDLDIILGIDANTYTTSGALHWYKNPNGNDSLNASQWTKYVISKTVSNIAQVSSGDLDYDGNPDIVIGEHHSENSGKTNIWFAPYNPETVSLWSEKELSQNDSWGSDIVDFDSDGYLDILVAHWKSDKYSWYKNPALEQYWVDNDAGSYSVIINNAILNDTFSNLTISVWFKATSENFTAQENRFSRIINKQPYQIAPDNQIKTIIWQVYNDSSILSTSTDAQQWNDGQWYHFVSEVGNGTLKTWVDNVEQSSPSTFTGKVNYSTDNIFVGDNSNLNRAFNGSIAEIRMWNRTLSTTEKTSLYNNGLTPNESLLTTNEILYITTRNGTDAVASDIINGNNLIFVTSTRDNSFRNMSLWNETIIDTGKAWTNGSMSIEAYDIDNDGDLDIGVNTIPNISINTAGYYMWYERINTQGTTFTRHLLEGDTDNTTWSHDMSIDDLNNDNYGDLVGSSASANKVMCYFNLPIQTNPIISSGDYYNSPDLNLSVNFSSTRYANKIDINTTYVKVINFSSDNETESLTYSIMKENKSISGNDLPYFSSSSSNQKTITSNLTDTITSDIILTTSSNPLINIVLDYNNGTTSTISSGWTIISSTIYKLENIDIPNGNLSISISHSGTGDNGGGGGGTNDDDVTISTINPLWECSSWSFCKDKKQTRTCIDINNINTDKPIEQRECSILGDLKDKGVELVNETNIEKGIRNIKQKTNSFAMVIREFFINLFSYFLEIFKK